MGVQIFGAEPDVMRRAEALVVERSRPDVLDINMGCPAPKVTDGHGGSSLLREPERAAAIVRAVVREIAPIPVTVKIRVGWNAAHKAAGAAVDVARRVVDAGAQLIAVHGRTREQKYEGRACWDTISAVAAAVPVPVIGNGDIVTPEDAAHRLRTSGCRGVALGRGARGRPWIFRQIRAHLNGEPVPAEPGPAGRAALGLEHIRRQRDEETRRLAASTVRARSPARYLDAQATCAVLSRMLPHVMLNMAWCPRGLPLPFGGPFPRVRNWPSDMKEDPSTNFIPRRPPNPHINSDRTGPRPPNFFRSKLLDSNELFFFGRTPSAPRRTLPF